MIWRILIAGGLVLAAAAGAVLIGGRKWLG
jgi:hypothetical protein